MLSQSLVIARKEIVDSLRDTRSVISSLMYALMGPLVVGLVSLSPAIRGASQSPAGRADVGVHLGFGFCRGDERRNGHDRGRKRAAVPTASALEPGPQTEYRPREMASRQPVFDRGTDTHSSGILSRICNVRNAHSSPLAAALARHGAWYLSLPILAASSNCCFQPLAAP